MICEKKGGAVWSTRAVITNGLSEIALMHVANEGYYKLPGGGIVESGMPAKYGQYFERARELAVLRYVRSVESSKRQ